MAMSGSDRAKIRFLLTHLIRGVTHYAVIGRSKIAFLLTHLIRGVTEMGKEFFPVVEISTHTPHTRCDCLQRYILN